MKTARIVACCLLIFPLVGTSSHVLRNRTKILRHSEAHPPSGKPFAAQLRAGRALFAAGRYQDAAESFRAVAAKARAAGNLDLAAVATGNAGGCQFALHQYQSALESFLEARRLTEMAGDPSKAAAQEANIASLYSEMGEMDSAVRWMENSLQHISGPERRQHLPALQIQMAVLRAEQGRMAEAERLFRQGINGADAAGDLGLYALGCNRMGEAFLLRGDVTRAEPALLEAFRVRKLHHLPLDTSYHRLGRLRLAQGDLVSASNLLDRAVELAVHAKNQMPTWDIYYSRGLVRLEQGRLGDALDDLRIAIRLASVWRWSAPAAETARVSVESKLDPVYSALVEAAGRRYLETGDTALVRETFSAAEENHAASLRALLSTGHASKDLPPAYWDALTKLQRAETVALGSPSTASRQAVELARAELARNEASTAPEGETVAATPRDLPARAQKALPPDAALFSFHLGDPDSWLWTDPRRHAPHNPAVIHFATHFVTSAQNSSYLTFEGSRERSQAGAIGLIALSLNPAGETETLTAPEIAQWPVAAELVTLSGCRSAAGVALPGAGLLGLTRAWLAAGAGSVVGSLWDTPDESGALFAALYRNLSPPRSADPALALDSAQREMIRAGGWLGQPRYWGAYFVVANE